ncbi:MAG: hypothetical protein M3O50_16855 [Myxococcota bacterium]|nr:hypothetical protein [Myxococcota bacterium]
MHSLVKYLVAAMLAWVPARVHAPREPIDEVLTRYESIAADVASVALDEKEAPLFAGPAGRSETALLMLSIASYESTFQRVVDDGTRLGDNGHSYCLMQIRVGGGETREGWTGKQLVDDRTLCFRAGLHILHASFHACRKLPLEDRLSAYVSGHCYANAAISRSRIWRARSWWAAHELPAEGAEES